MGRALPHLIALLLGVACALAIGCGDRSNLIPVGAAGDLKAQLAAAQAAVDAGRCQAAQAAIDRASARYQALPTAVDARLKRRIGDGIRSLRTTAAKDCLAARTDTTPTTTDTTPTVTQPPPTTTATTPTATQTTPTATQTTPTATETTPTPPATTDTTSNGGTGVPTP